MTSDRYYSRSGLSKRQSGREVRELSKSALESVRRNRSRPTANAPELHTQRPVHAMRGLGPASRVAREGGGDYRYVGNVAIYRARRNGVPHTGPEFVPYVWGAPRDTRMLAKLDMKAIELADLAFDRRRKGGPGNLDMAARAEIVNLYFENPDLTDLDISNIIGIGMSTVNRALRSIRRPAPPEPEPGRCPDCGYTLVSSGHRLTCLRDEPDAEPPVRKMLPADVARLRGAQ